MGKDRRTKSYQFKSGPSVEELWEDFAISLSLALMDLEEDDYLILTSKVTRQFVQFADQGAFGMRAEAQSNFFVEDEEHMIPVKSHKDLLKIGWNEPTYIPTGDVIPPVEGSPNYFIDVARPIPHAKLAAFAVDTLRRIFNVRYPGELTYSSCSSDNIPIRFPLLRIQRSKD